MLKKVIFTTLFLLLSTPLVKVNAQEYIQNYDVYIKIEQSGILKVSETITVNAEGDEIKRGIYRDFPTKYKAPLSIQRFHLASESELSEAKCAVANGNKQLTTNTWNSILCKAKAYKANGYNKNTTFEVQSVTKNGVNEPYFVEDKSNGKRLYIGDENVYLDPGIYTYQINYQTNYQIGYFSDHDELYYNAIGTGWAFPVQNASVLVELPTIVKGENLQLEGFTGSQGSTLKNFTAESINTLLEHNNKTNTAIEYTLTSPLQPYEGFTVVVGFDKGVVNEPTAFEKIMRLVMQNLFLIITRVATIAGMLFVFGFYVYNWRKYGRDPKTRGIVRNYDIPKDISPAGVSFITKMKFETPALTANIISLAIKGYLAIQEDKKRFSKNVFSLKMTGKSVENDLVEDEKILLKEIFKNGGVFVFKKSEYKKTKKLIDNLRIQIDRLYKGEYILTNSRLLVPPIVVSVFTGIAGLISGVFGSVVLLIIINIIFASALKARTLKGKEVYDQVMGLKEYLTAVEEPRYSSDLHKEIPFSMGVYEKYLPFAVALGVEPQWLARLKQYLETTKQVNPYTPAWYVGDIGNFNSILASGFSNNLTSTIASSSTAPGSSSGFSGGSSGGGGGGGGGGGW